MSRSKKFKKSSRKVILEKKTKILLKINTKDPAAEIFIIDSKLNLIDQAIGERFEKKLAPGIYKIKIRSGSQTNEEMVSLSGRELVVTKEFQPIEIASPAPILDTLQTHEDHISSAQDHSIRMRVNVRNGQGSSVYIFARCWTSNDPEKYQNRTDNPAKGLSLHSEQGELIADIEKRSSKGSGVKDPWAACLIGIEPGCYRLRLELDDGSQIEQTIAAMEGWQTQVFLLQNDYRANKKVSDWRADLAGAAILMSRYGDGFKADKEDLRLDELARLALRNNRNVLSRELRDRLLSGKFDNPMFGIYGAYLVLQGGERNLNLLNIVVDNLRRLFGMNHPDVEALALRVKGEANYTCTIPPMLRRSWEIIVEKSADNLNLVPPKSLAASVSTKIWGMEPFLLWLNQTPLSKDISLQDDLSPYKTALLRHLKLPNPKQHESFVSDKVIYSDVNAYNTIMDLSEDKSVISGLVKSLGLPYSKVEDIFNSINASDFDM